MIFILYSLKYYYNTIRHSMSNCAEKNHYVKFFRDEMKFHHVNYKSE